MADLQKITNSVSDLAQILEKTSGTISEAEAGLLISGFVFEKFGKTLRQFDYQQTFPAEQPACRASFTRTFAHEDWIDGESVVQAGTTPTEAGFNERFHLIESDLDALGQAVVQTSQCLADMRRSLRVLLDELRAQINQLHSDVHDLGGTKVETGPIKVPPFIGLLDQSKFQGSVILGDKRGSLWQTSAGIVVLPDITNAFNPKSLPDAQLNDGVLLGQFFANRPDIGLKFDGRTQFTKADLVTNFGDNLLSDGRPLRTVLDTVTDTAPFANLDAIVDVVARSEADRVRLLPGGNDAITSNFNEGAAVDKVADAPLTEAKFVSPQVRDALVASGIKTVGAMADLSSSQIADRLKRANVGFTGSEAAAAAATAKFLTHLR